jgi:hypothetical protein
MDIVRKLLLEMGNKSTSDIYLREIALLMEENETLKDRIRERDKLIKFYELERSGKNQKNGSSETGI